MNFVDNFCQLVFYLQPELLYVRFFVKMAVQLTLHTVTKDAQIKFVLSRIIFLTKLCKTSVICTS